MKYHLRALPLVAIALAATALAACDRTEDKQELAPKSQELKEEKAPTTGASYQVESSASEVTFLMDAELEKIFGRAPQSASGTIHVDLTDLSKTTGLVKIDLHKLSIYQKKRKSEDEEFGKEVKNEKQNEHMRTWLQISEDGPQEQREANRYAEFKITKVEPKTDLSQMAGTKRTAKLNVSGTLRLHGRSTPHTFPAQANFTFSGDKPQSVTVTSLEPLGVDLEKHDVRPRSAFDVLAEKTLEAMGSKVAKISQVNLTIVAQAKSSP